MISLLLQRLESLAVQRNPLLREKLNPGLPERRIRQLLARSGAQGDLQQIVSIYQWKNGTRLDPELVATRMGFFPGTVYHLLDLEMALGHLGHTRAAARKHRHLAAGVDYFPLFWNGKTSWIASDIGPSRRNRVILANHMADPPFTEAYASLEEFLLDGVDALERDQWLRCLSPNA